MHQVRFPAGLQVKLIIHCTAWTDHYNLISFLCSNKWKWTAILSSLATWRSDLKASKSVTNSWHTFPSQLYMDKNLAADWISQAASFIYRAPCWCAYMEHSEQTGRKTSQCCWKSHFPAAAVPHLHSSLCRVWKNYVQLELHRKQKTKAAQTSCLHCELNDKHLF